MAKCRQREQCQDMRANPRYNLIMLNVRKHLAKIAKGALRRILLTELGIIHWTFRIFCVSKNKEKFECLIFLGVIPKKIIFCHIYWNSNFTG